ncbi:MAG: hypothetical protein ACLPJJ_05485 [Acidocella sp.]|uniref:hypothetical protein n=1 Tax=Acidocella sp. TaxID=50710 RepID=UPI003FD6C762
MTEDKRRARRHYLTTQEESKIIGFRLPAKLAEAVKVEAAQRSMPLNTLFVEIWELYRKNKRVG